jgi:RsiW-degrading membrane proteinase PrsW (M82 family)
MVLPRHPDGSVIAREITLLGVSFALAVVAVLLYYCFIDRKRSKQAG